MSDIQKTIKILEEVPEEFSSKISMRDISEILTIMFSMNEDSDFIPNVEDFLEALYIKYKIDDGLKDIENGNYMTTEQLKEEIKNRLIK